jgi:hypothetical protein
MPIAKLVSQTLEREKEQERIPQTQVPGDKLITLTEAATLLGVNKGTLSRYADAGTILDNGQEVKERQVWKSSVLLLKQRREDEELLQDAKDLRIDSKSLPNRH